MLLVFAGGIGGASGALATGSTVSSSTASLPHTLAVTKAAGSTVVGVVAVVLGATAGRMT
jgi:fluoride ion exporter CrcB/FEX